MTLFSPTKFNYIAHYENNKGIKKQKAPIGAIYNTIFNYHIK